MRGKNNGTSSVMRLNTDGSSTPTSTAKNSASMRSACDNFMRDAACFSSLSTAFCTVSPIAKKLPTAATPESRLPHKTGSDHQPPTRNTACISRLSSTTHSATKPVSRRTTASTFATAIPPTIKCYQCTTKCKNLQAPFMQTKAGKCPNFVQFPQPVRLFCPLQREAFCGKIVAAKSFRQL